MAAQWLLALAAALGLAVDVVVQVAYCRWRSSGGLLRSVFVGFGAGLLVVAALTTGLSLHLAQAPAEFAGQLAANVLTFGALGYGYFHFINLGETARRVRILGEIVEAGGCLTEDEILKRYDGGEMVRVRLGRMAKNGQVSVREGRCLIKNPSLLRMARVIYALKYVLLGKRTNEACEN